MERQVVERRCERPRRRHSRRTPVSPIESATRAAARPCTHAPHTAASKAGTPRARKPAIDPGEDVAGARGGERGAAGVVERDTAGAAADRGSAITVPGPFSSDDGRAAVGQPLRGAIRSSPTGWPARRAYSPSWGVRIVGRAERLARAQRLEIAVERVEAVGVEHERDACLGDEREHRLPHRGVRAEPGPERERAEP